MTAEEIGIYTLLLCYCWIEGKLPNEQTFLARLTRTQQKKFSRLFNEKISFCFILDSQTDTWTHPRLEKERIKQETYRESQKLKGLKSAQSRLNHGSTTVQPNTNSSSSSSSTTAVTIKEKIDKKEIPLFKPSSLPSVVKSPKLNFGEEGKVLLTAEEHSKLINKYGIEKVKSCVSLLNDFLGAKKKDPYASHYHAIKKWVVDAVEAKKGHQAKTRTPQNGAEAFEHNLNFFKNLEEREKNGEIDVEKLFNFFGDSQKTLGSE